MKTIQDIINHKGGSVWDVRPEVSVYEALLLMKEQSIGALLVVTDDKEVAGIFSERDYARRMMGDTGADTRKTPVSELMTKNVQGIMAHRTIEECMALMTDKRVRHLPVFEEDELVGMVSIGDVVKAVIHDQAFLIDQLEHYITGSF